MTTRFRPFPPVNSAYGAPMGRRSAQIDINFENDSASSLAIPDRRMNMMRAALIGALAIMKAQSGPFGARARGVTALYISARLIARTLNQRRCARLLRKPWALQDLNPTGGCGPHN